MLRILIPVTVLLSLDGYISFSLAITARSESPAFFWSALSLVQILFLSTLWFFFVFIQSGADDKIRFEKQLLQGTFLSLGSLSFLLTFCGMRDLIALIHPMYGLFPSLTILSASVLALTWGALNARFKLVSPLIEIPVDALPEKLQGFKIVQLSDVHLGTGPKLKQVTAMIDRALSLKPNLIALTGDIIDGNITDIRAELKELARLNATHGVYFVLGNHECYWKAPDAIAAMKELGFTVLQNEGTTIEFNGEKIYIAGLNDPTSVMFGGEGPKISAPPTDSKFNLLLVHQPKYFKAVAKFNYHLQLSGHTHGGQFFPWNFAVKLVHPIHGGLEKFEKLWVYVSHGSGYWGPPVRLGTDGEVTELILKSSRS